VLSSSANHNNALNSQTAERFALKTAAFMLMKLFKVMIKEEYASEMMTPLFRTIFRKCVCEAALLQAGRLLQRTGRLYFQRTKEYRVCT